MLTVKGSFIQTELLLLTTGTAFACCGFPTVYLDKLFALFEGDKLQDFHELCKAQIADFASPKLFHCCNIQVLKNQNIVVHSQKMGQFEVKITALVGNADMTAGNVLFPFHLVVTVFLLF